MATEKLKSLITSFTPEGDFLSILSKDGAVKIWYTSNGNLLAEWKDPSEDFDNNYSCMACSFIGKKRRKERGTLLLALGTNAGHIMAIDVFTGERKWTSARCHLSGIAGLFFANKGRRLHIVGTDGMASEHDSETGELIAEFKASKRPISSSSSSDISVVVELEATDALMQGKEVTKKRAASDSDISNIAVDIEAMNALHFDDDLGEPTMGEKLANLNSNDDDKAMSHDQQSSSPHTKPPSADSVHVLLKQALHADDRPLLIDCLYTRDEKVIANSILLLNPSDILKLLDALIFIIQSRGALLVIAIPWLRSLLLQHASGIMSQESSLLALNSLYQLIESRVSTFKSALQLSSALDYLCAGVSDDADEEVKSTITPFIYEDKDSDEEPEDTMETDQDSEEESESINGFIDFEEGDDMSGY